MEEERVCLDCKKVLYGRLDKKFCNDLCRSNYNNNRNRDSNNLVRTVNSILRKNRRILSDLIGDEKDTAKTHLNKLQAKGYNFNYHTSIYITKKGDTYYFCYEYGYLALEKDFFAIVRNNRKEVE